MSAPPPPPPPCAPQAPKFGAKKPSNNNAPVVDRGVLLGEIHKGAKLRKAVTNDRSAPTVGNKKASPSSKYNTIGVHTHRQQNQAKDTALWRRGSQDGKKPNGGSPRGGGGFPPNKVGGMAGELFPGGIPKLQHKGQKQRIPGGNSSPKPVRIPNGPTNQTDIRSQINKNVSNGGSVINDNKTLPQRNVPGFRKFQPPTPHPVNNTSNDINSNITNNNHSVNVNTHPSPSQHTAGGIAMNTSARRMPGTHPPPPPPPPPGRPPNLPNNRTPNKNRPSSMIGRPLPPPPTLSGSSSSSSSSSSLNRAQPPPPPPPPTRGPPLPPLPPDRTVSGSGTLPRSKPPAQRPPPPPPTRPPAGPSSRSMSQSQEGPSPPQRTSSNPCTSNTDITKRGHFHNVMEFPPPEPFTGCQKTYPSRSARNSAGNRRAPPPPPPHPISAVR